MIPRPNAPLVPFARAALFATALLFGPFSRSAIQQESPAPGFAFRDVTAELGLLPDLAGIRGHAAGWGDADNDGWPDLYVATFHTSGSKANQFFRNRDGRFALDPQPVLRISTRASASLFADFDNDGDLDLFVSSMPSGPGTRLATREGHAIAPCSLFRNDGGGKYTNISRDNGACPETFGGRSAAVFDFDGDGRLDLLVGEDPNPGYNGSATRSSRLFRNLGDLRFEDVSTAAGLPEGIPGLGVAAADVNNDTWPDFFIACQDGGNRLFLNNGQGRFREAVTARQTFSWPDAGGDNMVCGVCFGDVNRDGRLDLLLGQHFDHPWVTPVANRLFLNRRIVNETPVFEEVTEAAGLVALPMKAPHVEIQDFDNDGWPDLYASVVKFAEDGRPCPLIFRNLGLHDGLPRFREDALSVNAFPTPADRALRRSGELFEKILSERSIVYTAPGPAADFDRDGRLDLFLASWWIEYPSLLLRNESPGGHWLEIRVVGSRGGNRMGIGSRVQIYQSGQAGHPEAFLGSREIAVGFGYASGQEAIAHFGLGQTSECDVEVLLPHNRGQLLRQRVRADQRITIQTTTETTNE